MSVFFWVMQVRSQFRKIFVAMGFEEMMTNAYVENRQVLAAAAVKLICNLIHGHDVVALTCSCD